jgi:hypothetical protein
MLLSIMQEKSGIMRCSELPTAISSKHIYITRSLQLPSMMGQHLEVNNNSMMNRCLSVANNLAYHGLKSANMGNNERKRGLRTHKFDSTPVLPNDALVKISDGVTVNKADQTQSSRIVNEIYQV